MFGNAKANGGSQGDNLIVGANKLVVLDQLWEEGNFINSARGEFRRWRKKSRSLEASLLKAERQMKSGNPTVK